MLRLEALFRDSVASEVAEVPAFRDLNSIFYVGGGLFLDSTVPVSFVSLISSRSSSSGFLSSISSYSSLISRKPDVFGVLRREKRVSGAVGDGFLSVSLSVKGNDGFVQESNGFLGRNGEKSAVEAVGFVEDKEQRVRSRGTGAMNTTKHLWAGAIAAMVSRFVFYFYLFLFCSFCILGQLLSLFALLLIGNVSCHFGYVS